MPAHARAAGRCIMLSVANNLHGTAHAGDLVFLNTPTKSAFENFKHLSWCLPLPKKDLLQTPMLLWLYGTC
jgi:hypothetical protein